MQNTEGICTLEVPIKLCSKDANYVVVWFATLALIK